MAYDVTKETDSNKIRNVMKNAKAKGADEVYWNAFRRLCELESVDQTDPLDREFYGTLAAYEELLTIKNGRRTMAMRTRQKLNNKGVRQCLEDWAKASTPAEGFNLLVDAGLVELTGEYLVVKYAAEFSENAVNSAKLRLEEAGWSD